MVDIAATADRDQEVHADGSLSLGRGAQHASASVRSVCSEHLPVERKTTDSFACVEAADVPGGRPRLSESYVEAWS